MLNPREIVHLLFVPVCRHNEKNIPLNRFMEDLKLSGYDEKDRKTILFGGMKTYEKLKLKEIQGLRPFYRSNSFKKEERKSKKVRKKTNWFNSKPGQENYQAVMFIESTPGDKLLKMLRETEEKNMIGKDKRIKFVSKSGKKLVHMLHIKDPFQENCKKEDCQPCEQAEGTENLTNCRKVNVPYKSKF